jgi:hypothetical protein
MSRPCQNNSRRIMFVKQMLVTIPRRGMKKLPAVTGKSFVGWSLMRKDSATAGAA